MDGRSVVNLVDAEAVGRLLETVRRHGVAHFVLRPDGSMDVEFYPDAPRSSAPLFPAAPPDGDVPAESPPDTDARLSSLPASDPLFDGVEGGP